MSAKDRLGHWQPGRNLLTAGDVAESFKLLIKRGNSLAAARLLALTYSDTSEEIATEAVYKAFNESQRS